MRTLASPNDLPEPPAHPAVDASDTEWDHWSVKNAEWMQHTDFRTRFAIAAEHGAIQTKNPSAYDWRLEARFRGLTRSQIEKLASGGVVATGQQYTFREKPERPLESIFVTSDMVLHAYNRLVADFVRGLEMQRAHRLRRNLEDMWRGIDAWPADHRLTPGWTKAAVAHAQRVIGTALLCVGSSVNFSDKVVERDCQAQLALIMSASAIDLPSWLGPQDSDFRGIDYKRLKPVGFYSENETLTGLFRAVRWLQVVPFRPERDTELVAFAILAEAAKSSGINADEKLLRQWLGLPNCTTVAGQAWLSEKVAAALRVSSGAPDFEEARVALAKQNPFIHANDDRRLDPKYSGLPSLSPILKILPAYLTADSMLLSDILVKQDSSIVRLPEGRMITAYLGDVQALKELGRTGWNEDIIEIIRQASARSSTAWSSDISTDSLHPYDDRLTFNSMLLHAMAALFLPPAKGAPVFIGGPAWLAKSRNTVLASWAGKKHTWVLNEVEPMTLAGSASPPPPPPGLIEPNPEFFHRMATLVEENFQWMERNGYLPGNALSDQNRGDAARYLRVARIIHEKKLDTLGNQHHENDWQEFYDMYGISPKGLPPENERAKLTAADFDRIRQSAIRSAEAILGSMDPDSSLEEIEHPPLYRRERWLTLLRCLRSLKEMSEKQLRGEEWNQDEREYLTTGVWSDYYSMTLEGDDGMPLDPKSTGPEIAPVASDPNTNKVLHVGTGDLSEIYVLYPWKGTPLLYRGPILPYYELISESRLNDEEWRAMLQSPNPPPQPEWLEPFLNK